MSSLILPRRNKLLYPGGNPGFDPSHPAAKGISPGSGMSVVSSQSGPVSALTGQPWVETSQSGVQVGTKLLNGIGFGSGVTAFSSSSYSLSGQSTASISGVTLAAILFNNGSTPGAGATLIALGPSSPQLLLWSSSTYGIYGGSSGPFNSADVFTPNVPIFYAASATTAGTVNIVARNLATGKILTQYTLSTTVTLGAPAGTVVIGNNGVSGGSPWLNGFVAGAMYAPSFLSMPQLLAWSQDPWSFWYPQKFDFGTALKPSGASPSGTLATTETADTAAFAGTIADQGSLTATEAADTLAFSGSVADKGTLAATETADAASISGLVADVGSLAATEAKDAAALVGNTNISGTLAATEGQDTAAFTSSSGISGTLAATDTQDSAGLSGNTGAGGSLAAAEAADSAALTGSVFDGGLLAATETADSVSFSGSVGASGPFVATDSSDSAAFAGAFIVTGTFAASESTDVLAFSSASVVTGTFSTTDALDSAALILTAFPPNYNPLERLKMYTGTLGAVSNREDWIVNIRFIDNDGNALDISTAQSIVTYVCPQGCPNSPVLSASLANKILITDNYTIQWAFLESDMQNLCASQYDVFCRVEMNDIWTQILSANVAIVEGGP